MSSTSVIRDMAVSTRGDTVAQESPGETSLGEDDLRHIYRLMALTRAIDEKAWALNRQGRISFVASCRGHEASQVASGYALRAGRDIVFTYYRDIGVALSLGMDPRDLFLSSFAKPTPVNGSSRHLPWHLCHPQLRLMPATSVVASQIPQAAGAALAAKLKKEDAATIVYFGDGATSEGDFHEAMNWAGVHRLPLVFFCENNGYAISTPVSRQMGVTNVAERARAYGFHGVVVDGSDPVAVHRATAAALQKARGGGGPTLIDAHVRRLRAHSSDDDNRRYMSAEQIDELQKHDPVTEFRQSLVRQGVLSQQAAEQIDGEVKAQAEGAAAAAEAAADPAPQDLMTELYAPPIPDIGSNGRGDPGQKLGR